VAVFSVTGSAPTATAAPDVGAAMYATVCLGTFFAGALALALLAAAGADGAGTLTGRGTFVAL
jgi:hypothetical protein